jgi:hypothetical protein
MINKLKMLFAMLLLGIGSVPAQAADQTTGDHAYTTAVFVTNRAGPEYDTQLPVLEDLLTAKLTDVGFSLLSRDLVVDAARKLDPAADQADETLSAQLADQSTALRLAQGMGADYILSASITSLSKQKRNVNAYGVQLANYTYTLRLSYKVVDANAGGSLTGGVVTATKTEQNTLHSNSGFNVVASDPSTPVAAPGSAAANADEGLMRAAKKYEKAIGLVMLVGPQGVIPMATAWGVGPNAFATNSHVTEPVKQHLAKGGEVRIVINKHPELTYRVTNAITHPRYGSAQPRNDGSVPAGGSYDVGILEVSGKLTSWFPVASAAELRQIDAGTRVAYLGFPMEERIGGGINVSSPVATMQTGIVTSNTDWWMGAGEPQTRFLVQHNLSSSGGASGSPVFNAEGHVIALHNAGTSNTGVKVEGGQTTVARMKSGLQINYAQRADLLAEIYNYRGSSAPGSAAATSAAPKQTVAVTFVDPDMEPILADLMDDATTQIAGALRAKIAQKRIAAPSSKAGPVSITINVETADLYIPDVQIGPENTVSIPNGKLAVAPLNVSVEVDGVAVGSAPGKIELRPGLSKIRLTREGYQTWERTINAVEGQTLTIAMQMSPEGLSRWQELTAFMNTLKDGAKLTDAQVKVLQGQATMLQNSGFKVDTKDAPTINVGTRSLFDW